MTNNKLHIYIAGPMRGYPRNNHDAFDRAEELLKSKRFGSPSILLKVDRDFGVNPEDDMTKKDLREALRRDANLIFDDCECIYMLRGWEKSDGARMEHAIAVALGLGIWYE